MKPAHTHSAPYRSDAQRWSAVEKRDPRADGQFFYGVVTTGIFCRPTCPSRRAHRANVRFFDSCAEAEQAGFRACLRCDPKGTSQSTREAESIARVCRLIASAEEIPDLDTLAASAGLSRFHFHRLFKKILGVTPRQYAVAHRAGRIRSGLQKNSSVTAAIYDAGFGSSSRFYENSTQTLGMTPTAFRSGGENQSIRYSIAPSPLGQLLVAGTEKGICSVILGDNTENVEEELRTFFPNATITKADDDFRDAIKTLIRHLDDPAQPAELPLDIRGTAFQQKVWQALREIPTGETASYSEIARRIGNPAAVRAVARACATNRIAIVVPCHRVIGLKGALTGYRWGVARKSQLLQKEAASIAT